MNTNKTISTKELEQILCVHKEEKYKEFSKWSEIKFSDLPVKPYSMASIHQGFQRKFYGLYNQ